MMMILRASSPRKRTRLLVSQSWSWEIAPRLEGQCCMWVEIPAPKDMGMMWELTPEQVQQIAQAGMIKAGEL